MYNKIISMALSATKIINNEIEKIRNYIYCIAYACPEMKRNKACPLWEIEDFSFSDKIKWIDELEDDKKETILKHHAKCKKNAIICPP